MRILKQADPNTFLSDADKISIIGEVFNIMCGARLFDVDGSFMGKAEQTAKSKLDAENINPKIYLSLSFDGYTFRIKPNIGYIIIPAGSKEFVANCKNNVEEFLVKHIPEYEERYLKGTQYENYLNSHAAVYSDVLSTTFVKPNVNKTKTCKQIAERNEKNNNRNGRGQRHTPENKSGVRIQFAHAVDYALENYARFTWYIISIDEFEFEITNANRQHRIAERVCSVFYDAMDITSLTHGQRVVEFYLSDLKFSKNLMSEKIKFSAYQNPIAEELKVKSANVHGRPKFVDISREVLAGNIDDFTITNVNEAGKYICSVCDEEVYDDNYVVLMADNMNGKIICPFCMHTGRDEIRNAPKKMYRVKFPMTIEEKIDSIPTHSARKKDVLKCAINGCLPTTTTENGIIIKHINLSGRYIAVSSKLNSIKFTRFAANLGDGVKMIPTYESDKILD